MLVGEQAGSLRNSPGERTLLSYWCRLSSAALGVGEVSRRAGSTSEEGVKENRNPGTTQKSRDGGMGVGGGGWRSATEWWEDSC